VIVALYLGLAAPGVGNRLVPPLAFAFQLITGRYSSVTSLGRILGFCTLPIACIWFPDALGGMVGGRIDKASPRSFAWFMGWVVLLVPAVMAAILWFQDVTTSPFVEKLWPTSLPN
jgi:hypothetical protein